MDFHLPEAFSGVQVSLGREKELFLAHYLRLEKQRFLHAILAEFIGQPELQQVALFTLNEGRDIDADLTFAPEFDVEEHTNYWESQSISNAIRSAFIPELGPFCDSRTIFRSALLTENGEHRFPTINDLLEFVESA